MTLRRPAFLLLAAVALTVPVSAAQANSVLVCGWAGCQLFVLGPHTPNPRSSPHMRFIMSPRQVTAGGTLRATARGFLPGEYVTVWDYTGKRWRGHAAQLPGGSASGGGTLTFVRETLANITQVGPHKVCLQGERSRRVACSTYTVLAAGPATGPGYVPPGTGSPSPGSSSSGSGWTPPTVGPGYVPPATS